MVLLSYKEVEGRKLQYQGKALCQKVYNTRSSNQSMMQRKNTVMNMKVTEILQYDSDGASVESEKSDNKESLNSERVFEILNENTLLI